MGYRMNSYWGIHLNYLFAAVSLAHLAYTESAPLKRLNFVNARKPWFNLVAPVQVQHEESRVVNKPYFANKPYFMYRESPFSSLSTQFATSASPSELNNNIQLGVPILPGLENGKNLDLFTAKDYDTLDRLDDSYTKTLISSFALNNNDNVNNNNRNFPAKIFHFVQNKYRPLDHSRRQRYNAKAVLQNVVVTPSKPHHFQDQKKLVKARPVPSTTKLSANKISTKTKGNVKKGAKKSINKNDKHLVKVMTLLKLLREYSGLQVKTADLLVKGNHHRYQHHQGHRKQMNNIQNGGNTVSSSEEVPEAETKVSEIEALKINKKLKELLTNVKTNEPVTTTSHHYVTIDTNTGEIVKEEGAGQIDENSLLAWDLKPVQKLTKHPFKMLSGSLRRLADSKVSLEPEDVVSVSAEHRTAGKSRHHPHEKSAFSREKIFTEDVNNESRQKLLNDVNENLRFVSTDELQDIQTKLRKLKSYRTHF